MAKKPGLAIPCTALNKAGDPCGCYALDADEKLCFMHSRQQARKRRAAQQYGGRQSANRKATLMLERVVGELVTDEDVPPVVIEDLADLTQYALDKMTAIEKRSAGTADISTYDSQELRKWSDFILKCQIAGGLGAMERIHQLEQALADMDAQAVKLLPAPEGD